MANEPRKTTPSSSIKAGAAPVIVLGASDLAKILTPRICIEALQSAYANLYRAPEDEPRTLGFKAPRGKFHVKAGLAPYVHDYFAAKINANFLNNASEHGLPTIQGLIALFSCETGSPLALLQSGELTGRRTAAAAALAAKYGARASSSRLAIIGAGVQAKYQIDAMAELFAIREIAVFDLDRSRAKALAKSTASGADIRVADSIPDAVRDADLCVTLTSSTRAILSKEMIAPGAFIAAVGADNPDKQEIDPALFGAARILVDDLEQCAKEGDLAHAIRAGVASQDSVHASLAELAAGAKTGRLTDSEIVLFDSTGSGVQDVAAAAAAYEAALELGIGRQISFE